MPDPERDRLPDGVLPPDGPNLLAASPGVGKSTFARCRAVVRRTAPIASREDSDRSISPKSDTTTGAAIREIRFGRKAVLDSLRRLTGKEAPKRQGKGRKDDPCLHSVPGSLRRPEPQDRIVERSERSPSVRGTPSAGSLGPACRRNPPWRRRACRTATGSRHRQGREIVKSTETPAKLRKSGWRADFGPRRSAGSPADTARAQQRRPSCRCARPTRETIQEARTDPTDGHRQYRNQERVVAGDAH